MENINKEYERKLLTYIMKRAADGFNNSEPMDPLNDIIRAAYDYLNPPVPKYTAAGKVIVEVTSLKGYDHYIDGSLVFQGAPGDYEDLTGWLREQACLIGINRYGAQSKDAVEVVFSKVEDFPGYDFDNLENYVDKPPATVQELRDHFAKGLKA